MSRNLMARIAVAAVAIPVILWIAYSGGAWLFGLVAVLALAALLEFLINEGYRFTSIFFWLAVLALAGTLVLTAESLPFQRLQTLGFLNFEFPFVLMTAPVVVLFFLISGMLFAIGKKTPAELFTAHSRLVWGVTYICMLYPFVYALGNSAVIYDAIAPASCGDLLLFLFGLLWVGDTAAMGFGHWLGKHKLAPGVSPRKTVEGFIGGIVGALAIGVLMHFWKFPHLQFYHIMLVAIGCSIFGQLGDLVESMWKRSLGIKDSSAIIPGHGGVLDRFDSLLFAAPFMYGYILLFLT